ncbi:hypothetical protein RRG08_013985 [Elysia crispata]|uniref:Uncharacterized protein n=1 Tax=Elysia crispata TaxID=231223 RepID=A0AAE1CWD4_9GAST|nr:hypothetical protein RRG08_013985 [Elysia crispata]
MCYCELPARAGFSLYQRVGKGFISEWCWWVVRYDLRLEIYRKSPSSHLWASVPGQGVSAASRTGQDRVSCGGSVRSSSEECSHECRPATPGLADTRLRVPRCFGCRLFMGSNSDSFQRSRLDLLRILLDIFLKLYPPPALLCPSLAPLSFPTSPHFPSSLTASQTLPNKLL